MFEGKAKVFVFLFFGYIAQFKHKMLILSKNLQTISCLVLFSVPVWSDIGTSLVSGYIFFFSAQKIISIFYGEMENVLAEK